MRSIKGRPYRGKSLPRHYQRGNPVTDAKIPFDLMDGAPADNDSEATELTEVIASLPDHQIESLVRGVFRAALGWERTGDMGLLTCFAEDTLVTTRLRRDPKTDQAYRKARRTPADPDSTVDVDEMLQELGLH
jgi:hypothetical protein